MTTLVLVNANYLVASATADSSVNVQAAVILHYDTYYPSISLPEMHQTFQEALSLLKTEGFPMDELMIVTWLNTFDNPEELAWLKQTLAKYGISTGSEQLGLFVAPDDAMDMGVLNYTLDTFKSRVGWCPYFVAGFSASSKTYSVLADHGVKLSFFNLWEEGEDYSYRGFSTGDNLTGANWEGSPFQPYKPSKFSANAPGTTKEDEINIWEAHWITRNPSYAYMAVNSRNWGSIHPNDLLQADATGLQRSSVAEATGKFGKILDLIDFNSQYNQLMTVSYPIEVSYLKNSEVFDVWRNSIRELQRRQYAFVNAVDLRDNLERLAPEAPHTPVMMWYDDATSSDIVVKGENTPFAMLTSPYGRFIYARRDAQSDSGAPLISVVSYTTARAHDATFQSIRELTGVDDFKMNTLVNGEPVEMRWPGDIKNVTINPGKAIAIRWAYLKNNVPYVEYQVTTYLTPYGILFEKGLTFKQNVQASVSMLHHFNVQENSPTTPSDMEVRMETDEADYYRFSPTNQEATEIRLAVNDSLIFTANDGYTLGVTVASGKPNVVRCFDERGASAYETLEFGFAARDFLQGERLQLSYALTPARDLQDAQRLAALVAAFAHAEGAVPVPELSSESVVPLLAVLIVISPAAAVLAKRFSRRQTKTQS